MLIRGDLSPIAVKIAAYRTVPEVRSRKSVLYAGDNEEKEQELITSGDKR